MNDFFFTAGGWKFVMFASEQGVINEQPLTINLDARTISVPSAVATCASVQKDQLAEMLIFEVDRFVDIMDLSNTEIFVQWQNAAGEGDTRVTIVDFASKPEKMLFAWPLTDDVTSVAGPVKFSVRFFIQNAAGKIIYSLNTQEAVLNIKPALAADLNETLVEPVRANMFKNIVFNSTNAAYGKTAPHKPRFDTPGADISLLTIEDGKYVASPLNKVDNEYVANLVRDTVTFCAQAYTTDLGDIDYEWFYVFENADGQMEAKKFTMHDEDNNDRVHYVYIPLPAERMEVEGITPNSNARYFIQKMDENGEPVIPLAYDPYSIIADNFPVEEGTVLYERYSAFTVPEADEDELTNDEVVGKYYVAAINYKGELSTAITPVRSSECVLPGPAAIQIQTDLEPAKIVDKVVVDDQAVVAPGEVLSIKLPDNVYNADIVYNWEMKETEDGEYAPVISPAVEGDEDDIASTGSNLNISKLGWYRANIVSTLNRKSISTNSEECKVTFQPEAPEIESNMDSYYCELNAADGEKQLIVSAKVNNQDNSLYSEKIEYVWYIAHNSELRKLTEADADIATAQDNVLTVKYLNTHNIYTFNCQAYNILNGEKAGSDFMDNSFVVLYETVKNV